MTSAINALDQAAKKRVVVEVHSGDTVRVHQKVKEGNKTRVQVFEGLVIRVSRTNSASASIVVRRIASGVGVEKSYLIHSPLVTKIEVTKRTKVRRNYLSYMRGLSGKSTRLAGVDFDREAVNDVHDAEAEAEEAKLKAEAEAAHKAEEAKKAEAAAKEDAKFEAAVASHDQSDEEPKKAE